jgi:hypothetical protein
MERLFPFFLTALPLFYRDVLQKGKTVEIAENSSEGQLEK